jgi:two-component system, chemotaxis family, chemotaxis protein CheY
MIMGPSYFSKEPDALLSKISILVVDTDHKILDLISNVLSKLGFSTIHKAQDAFEAIRILNAHKTDLVITDWDLNPRMQNLFGPLEDEHSAITDSWQMSAPTSGASLVRFLRASKQSPNPYVSIIMLTSQALKNNIEAARDSGVNEILLKPISAEGLCNRIMRIIEHTPPFIVSPNYTGPCRRRMNAPHPGQPDRRMRDNSQGQALMHDRRPSA